MIDMEDASYVDRAIGLRSLLASHGVPAAVALQAYLRRTESDCAAFLRDRAPCVRLVKGAFSEQAVAWTRQPQITEAYLRLAALMLSDKARDGGLFPVFATHDEALMDSIRGLARESGCPPGQYEFEMGQMWFCCSRLSYVLLSR